MTSLDDKARQRYQGNQGETYHQAKRAIPEAAFPWVSRLRAAKIAPGVGRSDTVLEYGVGLGWNLAELTCGRKIGLDVGEFLKDSVRRRGIEFLTDPHGQPEGSVDVVVCHHMLEHAGHPAAILEAIHRLLRPKGRLLLFVPYEKERRFRRFNPGEPNHHLYSWNPQTLGNLVTEVGFSIERAGVAPFGQERFAAVWANRLRWGEPGFRLIHWLANSLTQEREVRIVATRP